MARCWSMFNFWIHKQGMNMLYFNKMFFMWFSIAAINTFEGRYVNVPNVFFYSSVLRLHEISYHLHFHKHCLFTLVLYILSFFGMLPGSAHICINIKYWLFIREGLIEIFSRVIQLLEAESDDKAYFTISQIQVKSIL